MVGDFQGVDDSATLVDKFWKRAKTYATKPLDTKDETKTERKNKNAVDSQDIPLHLLYSDAMRT